MDKPKLKEVFGDLLKEFYSLKLENNDDQQQVMEEVITWNDRFKKAFYGSKEGFIDECLEKIFEFQKQIDKVEEDSFLHATLLSNQNIFIGRLSSELDREYKMIYAKRKRVQAEARIKATKDKEAHAELAVVELREEEADAYGDMHRWRNAFESTKEKIHMIKAKHKIGDQSWNDANHGS